MAKVVVKNEALTVFESSEGQAYVCRFEVPPTYEHKNDLVSQLRNKLIAISPDAYTLAKAFAAAASYQTPDVTLAKEAVSNQRNATGQDEQ